MVTTTHQTLHTKFSLISVCSQFREALLVIEIWFLSFLPFLLLATRRCRIQSVIVIAVGKLVSLRSLALASATTGATTAVTTSLALPSAVASAIMATTASSSSVAVIFRLLSIPLEVAFLRVNRCQSLKLLLSCELFNLLHLN